MTNEISKKIENLVAIRDIHTRADINETPHGTYFGDCAECKTAAGKLGITKNEFALFYASGFDFTIRREKILTTTIEIFNVEMKKNLRELKARAIANGATATKSKIDNSAFQKTWNEVDSALKIADLSMCMGAAHALYNIFRRKYSAKDLTNVDKYILDATATDGINAKN